VTNAGIVVTGGAVRLTDSGLGCPEVPRCTADSMVATREMGVHGAIEFGNRLLTFVLAAAVLTALATAWRAGRRDLVGYAAALLVGVAGQAVLGAVTVLTELDPRTVMAHFLVSMVLIAVAVVAHHRAGGDPPTAGSTPRPLLIGAYALVVAVAATLAAGTVVTGTGPHSGDPDATDRLPFALEDVTQLHADLVFLVVGLTTGLLAGVLAAARHLLRRTAVLLGVLLVQGVGGVVQYVTDLPVLLVGLHVLGATLVWIATLRVVVAARSGRAGAVSAAAAAGSRRAPAWAGSR
jgi:cytochrome c oxidase assembly protein subunit 15